VYDTTAPAIPGSISAVGGVGLIHVDWSQVYDSDVEQYFLYRKVQTSDGGAFGSSWTFLAAVKGTDFVDKDVEYHITDADDPNYPQWRKYIYAVRATDYANNASSYREMSTANAVYATQATGDDIAANSITANHINVALDLLVGRQITVGSGIQIGAGVGPVGSEFDGIYVTDGTNYVKLSADEVEIKGNLILGTGDNYIKMEDAKMFIKDGNRSSGTSFVYLTVDTAADTGNTEKEVYAVSVYQNSSGHTVQAGTFLYAEDDEAVNQIQMILNRDSDDLQDNTAEILAVLYSLNGTYFVKPTIEFFMTSSNGAYITFSHPVRPPVYLAATSLPSDVAVGSMAIKEISSGVYYPVWFDGASWYRPDGRTAV
jgi:hypothetical protein